VLFKVIILSLLLLIAALLLAKLVVKLIAKVIKFKNYRLTGNFYFLLEILIVFALGLFMGGRLLNLCF